METRLVWDTDYRLRNLQNFENKCLTGTSVNPSSFNIFVNIVNINGNLEVVNTLLSLFRFCVKSFLRLLNSKTRITI
jgi:hypothetical protein